MLKIFKYQKITDAFTTHTLVEPDYNLLKTDERIIELCVLEDETYVSVPDDIVLPEQPKIISKTLEEVQLDDTLKVQISKASVHVQLLNQRVVEKIREKYDVNDELGMTRKKVAAETGSATKFNSYNTYVKSCIAWGDSEKTKLGL